MTSEKRAELIRKTKNKYHLEDDWLIETSEKIVLKRAAILKIQRQELIRIEINEFKVEQLETKLGREDGIYMTGTATKYNREGYRVKECDSSASATPFNTTFPYKMEVAEFRLKSRLVREIMELDAFLGIDELQGKLDDNASKDAVEEAINHLMSESNRTRK